MGFAKLYCDDCDSQRNVKIKYVSDLFDVMCPVCKSTNVWIEEILFPEVTNNNVELGKGGCGRQRSWKK